MADMIYLPVAPSFRGFGAAMVKEATGAARQSSAAINSELAKGGKAAGQAAGKGVADGMMSSAKAAEAAAGRVAAARKREADAAASVALAEAKVADARSKGSGADVIARKEADVEAARRRQISAAQQLTAAEDDHAKVRAGEPGRAQAVIRSSAGVEKARLTAADATDKVKLAEADFARVQKDSEASPTKVAAAHATLIKARSEQTSATEMLRAKEELHAATLADVASKTSDAGEKSLTAGEKVRRFGSGLSDAAEKARGFALGVAGAVGVLGKMAFSAASEAQQAVGAVESVFGEQAAAVQRFADSSAQSVGLATSQYDQLAAVLGAQMKNLGMPMDQLAGQTNNLITIGADMAAAFGGTTSDAVEALGSALRGERDPIERYGVSITQASIDAWKASHGLSGLTGAAEQNANMMATLGLITEQTKDVQGQFGREADTAAGQQQRATAEFENAKAAIGQGLLPVVTELAQAFSGVARFAGEHPALISALAVAFGGLSLAILGFNLVAPIFTAISVAAAAAELSMWGYVAAQAAAVAPILGIVAAVAAVGVALWAFFTKTEVGRRMWDGLVGAFRTGVDWLKGVFSAAWDGLVRAMQPVVDFFGKVADAAQGVWDVLSRGDFTGGIFGLEEDSGFVDFLLRVHDTVANLWSTMSSAPSAVWDWLVGVWRSLEPILSRVADIVGGALGSAFSSLWDSVKSVGGALLDAGSAVGGAVLSAFMGLWDAAKGLWDGLTKLWDVLGPILLPVLKVVGAIVGGVVLGAIILLAKALQLVAGIVKIAADVFSWLVSTILVPIIGFVGTLAHGLGTVLGGAFSLIGSVVKVVGAVVVGVWHGIQAGWELLVAGLSMLWTSVLKPVFDAVMTAVKWVAAILLTVLITPAILAWNLLSTAIQFAWTTLIKPTWDMLAMAAMWLWATVLMPVFGWIKLGFQAIGDAIGWVWTTLIKPAWDAVAFAAQWLWTSVLMPVFGFIKAGFQAVGDFFTFVWVSIIKPAWDALGAGIAWVWQNVISPAWDALKAALGAVGDFFSWVWNSVIKPAWDALGAGIAWVIDSVVQPAFERVKSALESVKNFFSTVVDGIRTVWDQLKGHVARPINFVIETVWNNGLVRAWNKIGEFLPGLPAASTLAPVAFARGGEVPMTPGAQRGKDSVNALLMPGEHVLTTDEVKAMGGQSGVYAFRNALHGNFDPAAVGGESMLPRFSKGGAVEGSGVRLDPLPGEGGLQPIAVLARRLLFRIWPDLNSTGGIGGYRPSDPFPEHPSGRALDIMVNGRPDLGDVINAWIHANTKVLPIEHTIWKQRWRPPGDPDGLGPNGLMGDRGDPTQNHMDHVHAWYAPKDIDPNVIPDGLVGADGLTREDRMGLIKKKIQEILDKALDPIKEGMAGVIGSPPPEWLGIPPRMFDKTKKGAVDGAFDFVDKIAGDLKDVYDLAKKVTVGVTGLFRDEGGMLPTGQSVVTNETGRPEAVLNWRQVERIRDILSSLGSIDQLRDLAEIVSGMAATGVYDPRASAFGITGADDELVAALWKTRDEWASTSAAIRDVFTKAGEKARTGYTDEALDFFGFKGVVDAVAGIRDAFDPSKATSTAVSGTAVSTDPGATPTGTGVSSGKSLVYGDPSKQYVTKDVELETKMPDLPTTGTPGSGPAQDQVREAFKPYGWDKEPYWSAAVWIIDHESGWNPTAVNASSGAFGLFQFLGGTKDTYLPDSNPNPKIQGEAGARYIKDRYGDPLKAKAFWEANGWYDRGGLANSVGYMAKATLEPERVLSGVQTSAFDRLVFDVLPDLFSVLDAAGGEVRQAWLGDAGAPGSGPAGPNLAVLGSDAADAAGRVQRAVEQALPDEASGPANRPSGPLVVIEKLEARDEDEAMRAAMREARRVARSTSMVGGWR